MVFQLLSIQFKMCDTLLCRFAGEYCVRSPDKGIDETTVLWSITRRQGKKRRRKGRERASILTTDTLHYVETAGF